MVLDSVTHLFTLRFHGLESVEWKTTSANQLGSTSSCIGPIQWFMCVTVWINFSLHILRFVLSQVCSDCANVAMNAK